jgi:hypothetical protein
MKDLLIVCFSPSKQTFNVITWVIEGYFKGADDNIHHKSLEKKLFDQRFLNLLIDYEQRTQVTWNSNLNLLKDYE